MTGQLGIVDAQGRDPGESRLQSRQEFRLELAVETAPFVDILFIAGYVRVEQDRVDDAVTVFAEAAQAHEQCQAHRIIVGFERHLAGRAVLIADDFLEVDVIDALVLARVAAEGKAFLHLADEQAEGLAQVAGIVAIENGRFRRRIICIFARFGADFDDFPRFDDEHTLAVVDSNP